jgi:predicted dehydrogenase
VAWIADKDQERARIVGKNYGVPCYGEDVLTAALPHYDILLFGIPYGARAPYYERFSRDPAAWYVEKPFARTVVEHLDLCGRRADYALACGFQRRASGVVRVVREVIAGEMFGRARAVEVGLGSRGGILGGGSYITNPSLAGGGILLELGIHCVDAVLFFVQAVGINIKESQMIVEDNMDLHTQAVVAVNGPEGREVEFRLTISNLVETNDCIIVRCDHANLSFSIFSEDGISVTATRGGSTFRLKERREFYPRSGDQVLYAFWKAFVDGWRSKTANFTSARSALLTTELIDGLRSAHLNPR